MKRGVNAAFHAERERQTPRAVNPFIFLVKYIPAINPFILFTSRPVYALSPLRCFVTASLHFLSHGL